MNWIKYENPNSIRGHKYQCLMNLSTGAYIHINTQAKQPDTDPNLYIWCQFPGMNEKKLYYGTQVECIRIIDKFGKKLGATDIAPWD